MELLLIPLYLILGFFLAIFLIRLSVEIIVALMSFITDYVLPPLGFIFDKIKQIFKI